MSDVINSIMKQARTAEEWKFLMGSPVGRRLFIRLMESGRMFSPRFDRDATPTAMAYDNGAHDLVAAIYSDVEETCPELLSIALAERLSDVSDRDEDEEESEKWQI